MNQYLSLRGAWNPGARLQFNIAEDYVQSNQFQDLQNIGSAQTGTGSYKTNTVAATAAYVAPQFRTALTYTNQFNINDQQQINNNMTNAGNLSAEITDQRTTYTGAYTITRGDFSNAPNASYWDQVGTGRVAYTLTPVINLTGFGTFQWHQQDEGDAFNYILAQARVGATFNLAGNQSLLNIQGGAIGYDPAQGETKIRPTFLIGWTQRFAYNTSLTASFESTYLSDFSGVAPTGLSYVRSASLILTTNYFRDLTATLGGAWYWQNFAQTTPEGGPAGTKQETWSVQARVAISLFPVSLHGDLLQPDRPDFWRAIPGKHCRNLRNSQLRLQVTLPVAIGWASSSVSRRAAPLISSRALLPLTRSDRNWRTWIRRSARSLALEARELSDTPSNATLSRRPDSQSIA